MILPAIPNVAALGNQAKSETQKSIQEGKAVPVPVVVSSENTVKESGKNNTQPVIAKQEKRDQLASRSIESRRSNWSMVVETSKKYIGVPYASGGVSQSGFDCSGFVQFVYKQHGLLLPRNSTDMFHEGARVTDLRSGDLVFFNTSGTGVSHVGIYIGNNRFISATSKGVKIDHLYDSYWGPKYLGAKRI
jgi:cell wall-associated NlpC family hydrolase